MILAQEFAGIPIELPAWTQYATWALLALLAIALVAFIWRTAVKAKDRSQLGEIHAKVNIMLLILRSYQEREEQNYGYQQYANEHYAPQSGISHPPEGNEVTDQHERFNSL